MGAQITGTAVLVALLACGLASGGETERDVADRDVQALAKKIDEMIAKRWAEAKVEPAPRADDSEFLRRVYLDLSGRVPSVAEARQFLADRRPDKRARLVEQLLASSRYVAHFTNVWRALLLPEAGNNFQVKLQQGTFEAWLKQQVAANAGYNQMVRDLLTARVELGGRGGLANLAKPSPLTFYLAKEFRPENLAAGTARVFLGVSVGCAQCHDHPFAAWKREQFWGFAAYFAGIKSQRQMDFLVPTAEDPSKRELTIPGSDKVVRARFLDGVEPVWQPSVGTRATLANWVTSPANPYFARAIVNRTWSYFYGTGLIEPVDEMVGGTSTASHPELLDLLAREFIAHKFDLKFLYRTLTATRAYQLASTRTHSSQEDPTRFARMPLRGLTAEQLFDSVALATGYRDSGNEDNSIASLLAGNRSARAEFLVKFANQTEKATESRTSILQALSLMNGRIISDATSLTRSETLTAVVDAPFLTTAERIETLYLATLSRQPTARELKRTVQFVQEAERLADRKDAKAHQAASNHALADIFWALLNSPEFGLNH